MKISVFVLFCFHQLICLVAGVTVLKLYLIFFFIYVYYTIQIIAFYSKTLRLWNIFSLELLMSLNLYMLQLCFIYLLDYFTWIPLRFRPLTPGPSFCLKNYFWTPELLSFHYRFIFHYTLCISITSFVTYLSKDRLGNPSFLC